MRIEKNGDVVTIYLDEVLDANNAEASKIEIMRSIDEYEAKDVIFDAAKLVYIASAGLRVLLSTQKKLEKKVSVINISKEVMDIFKIACFENIMDLRKV